MITGWTRSTLKSLKFKKYFLFILILITSIYLILNQFNNYKSNKIKENYRNSKKLTGFSTSSSNSTLNFNLINLQNSISNLKTLPQLLTHELISNYSIPINLTSELSPYHLERYSSLLPSSSSTSSHSRNLNSPDPRISNELNYFIALNLINSSEILPTLILTLVSIFQLLSSSSSTTTKFHLSIYESSSSDSTPAQLYLFSKILDSLATIEGGGVKVGYEIKSVSLTEDPGGFVEGRRIERLAGLRNEVLGSLFRAPQGTYDRLLFLNDIILSPSDILETMLQSEIQRTDLTCGMDYKELRIKEFDDYAKEGRGGYPMVFYDTWVGRSIEGLPFYKISPTGTWSLPSTPLQYTPSSRRFNALLPISVFSCFNGIALFRVEHFYDLPGSGKGVKRKEGGEEGEEGKGLRFRTQNGSDEQSECYLICVDLWKRLSPFPPSFSSSFSSNPNPNPRGARIQILPRVSVAYSVPEYERVRKDIVEVDFLPGFLSEQEREEEVKFERFPPSLVRMYPYARWGEGRWVSPF